MPRHSELGLRESVGQERTKYVFHLACNTGDHADTRSFKHVVENPTYTAADQIGDSCSLEEQEAFKRGEGLQRQF